MEFYRNRSSKAVYSKFKQDKNDPKYSYVSSQKNPKDKYLVRTANVELVIKNGVSERILVWNKEEGWHRK